MKRAALGLQMHSGWGVLVAVSVDAGAVQVLDRRRILVIDPRIPGAKQPYHYAASLGISDSEACISEFATASEGLALAAVEELVKYLGSRHYCVVGSAVVCASGRPLPSLSKILASHPLIHTAEGEFFRNAARRACEHLQIPVTAIRERQLEELAKTTFGSAAARIIRGLAMWGSSVGPPWTKDHKTAALAASLILARAEAVA
jgi:hypothetical protein